MKHLLGAAAAIALLATTSSAFGQAALDTPGANNAQGWIEHTDANGQNKRMVPKGLVVSGDNDRVDNGLGNGGENLETPNNNGEDVPQDNDPNDNANTEPRSWWYSLARVIDRATAISRKRAE